MYATDKQKQELKALILNYMDVKQLDSPNIGELLIELTHSGYFPHIQSYIGVLFEMFSITVSGIAETDGYVPSEHVKLNAGNALSALGIFLNNINTPAFEAYLALLQCEPDAKLYEGNAKELLSKFTLK